MIIGFLNTYITKEITFFKIEIDKLLYLLYYNYNKRGGNDDYRL